MKDLIVGDLHGRKNNIDKIEQTLKETRALAAECDRTIFLGDIFDEKGYLRTEVVNLYLRYLSDWPGLVVILVGNHDYSNSIECKIHALEVFKHIKNVKVIDNLMYDIKAQSVYLPYRHDNTDIIRFLKDIPIKDELVVYGHVGIDGCQYSSGSFEKSSLKKDHFKEFKRVFLGHIHKPQDFNQITVVGTPFTKDYGEARESKHVAIYNSETNETTYVPLNVPKHLIFQYEITSLKDLKKIKEELKDVKNDCVRLVIKAPESIAKKVKAASFDIPIDSLKIEIIKEKVEKTNISEVLSFNAMCKQYLSTIQGEFDLNELSALSDKILEQAKNEST